MEFAAAKLNDEFFYFICNSPTDHTVMTEITSVKAAGQQGSGLR